MIREFVSIVRTDPFGWGVAMGLAVLGARAEWPTARGDAGRSAAVAVGPEGALVAAWVVETGTPEPAWAAEARGSLWQKIDRPLVARAADDLAPVPVVADGAVVFGTTSDEVRCVDRDTGRTRWRRFCGGPVRFAPVIAGGRVFVGSDDGRVQALDLRDGQVVWSVAPGPDEPWISGNGRLVSPHPLRTGLLVSEGIV
ncbi:MAG: PQQ-binding-like beta-propeller repeat protein, partial [Verrucomicrobiota bacterium]